MMRGAARLLGCRGATALLFTCGWTARLAAAQCTFSNATSSVVTGGNTPYNRLAITPDGLMLFSTAIDEGPGHPVYIVSGFDVNPDGQLTLVSEFTYESDDDSLYASPVITSLDGINVYVVFPILSKIYSFETSDISSDINKDSIGSESTDFLYLGMTSSDTRLIAVDGDEIYRFERESNGHLKHFDELSEAGITAATADPTGDYVVLVTSSSAVKVFNVGASVVKDALTGSIQFVYSSSSGILGPSYIAVSPTSVGVYIEGIGGKVVMLDSSNDGGKLLLGGSFSDEVDPASYTSVAISPNGTTFYGLNQATGDLVQHARTPDGDLGPVVCGVATGEPDAYNRLLPSPDGNHIFVADGERVLTFEFASGQTPSPTSLPTTLFPSPSPTESSTAAPVGKLVSGIASPTKQTEPGFASPTKYPCEILADGPLLAPFCTTCGHNKGTPGPTPGPTTAPPTELPTVAPSLTSGEGTPGPTPGPTLAPMTSAPLPTSGPAVAVLLPAPDLESAVLSDTQSTFSLHFSSTCFCPEVGGSGADVALCGYDIVSGEFEKWCDIERVLDEKTRTTFGNQSTCEWSEDSLTAVIIYDDAYVDSWDAGVNITLAGGYILGGIPSVSDGVIEYATGTVSLEGRTSPPELLQAMFSNDGESIIVGFSPESSSSSRLLNATDAASGGGPGSCEALLNASSITAIGKGAACEWTGERELTIGLGYDAIVEPDTGSGVSCLSQVSCISLLDGGVRTEALAVLSSEGSTPVLAPENPPRVSTVLVAPQTVGLCGKLTLDGRASSGALSRTMSASWNVSAASGANTSILEASLALLEGSLVAELDAAALEPGVEFMFALTAGNFLGDTNEATAAVTRIAEDVPSIAVLGSATRVVKRSRPASLRITATSPACGERQLLDYSWSEAGGAGYDEVGTEVFQGLAQRDPTVITFPAYTLGYPGSSYLFTATATSQLSEASASTTVEVSVEQGVLRANIQGGEFRQHSVGNDLVLDGSDSVDDDDIAEFDMRYEWWCSQNCTSQDGWAVDADGSVLVIPSEELESGLIYEFFLNVSKGSVDSTDIYSQLRWDTASVKVQVVSFEAPEVILIAKDDSPKKDPTKKVVIYGSVSEQPSSYDLQWTQAEGDLDLEEREWSTVFATAQTGANLVIPSGVLTGGSTYAFRLSATDVASQATGFADISLTINAPPTGGHVDAAPRAGVAAVDTFVLECLDWTDEVDDLPLLFSFSYNNEEESGQQRSLSVLAVESPEWHGSLPLGPSSNNYTMLIKGQVSDSFGATAVSTRDTIGSPVTVRVTGWTASNNDSTILDAYQAAHDETADTPGQATSTVRAYASLLVDQFDDASQHVPEKIALYQGLMATMVQDAADDFEVLEYSSTTAGALLDTMVVVSGSENLRTSDSQEAILSLSAGVLERAVEEDSSDFDSFSPTLELLDNVIGGYNASSAGIVGREELGDVAAEKRVITACRLQNHLLPETVRSMALLMTSGLEDGEDAARIGNSFIDVLCLVTSQTATMDFEAGSLSVSVPDGAINPTSVQRRRRRMTTSSASPVGGKEYGRIMQRRRMDSIVTASDTSTIMIASLQFSANGSPSSQVDAGVSSITITTSSEGEDIALSAPVRMTMRASIATTSSNSPSCVYYNEITGLWDEDGLVTEAAITPMDKSNGAELMNSNITCWSFHLSDFTISADEVRSGFQNVDLTAGISVFLKVREISRIGVLLLLMVLLLLAVVRTTSRMADVKTNLSRQLAGKTDEVYIATGKSRNRPTLAALVEEDPLPDRHHRHAKRRLYRRAKTTLRQHIMKRCRSLARQTRSFLRLVLRYHPWFGIVAPSSSDLTLTREQLSLLIFAQVLVHMLVEASFVANSTSHKIRALHIAVSLAVSMPASILIPKLFAAAAAPPPSVTVTTLNAWEKVVPSTSQEVLTAQDMTSTKPDSQTRWLREPNKVVAVFRLISSAVLRRKSRASPSFRGGQPYSTGGAVDRGTNLVWSGLWQLVLDLVCVALSATIGIEDQLEKALIFTTVAGLLSGLLFLDAVLSTRASSFSILNFKVLFSIVFARMVMTGLQVVVAFHGVRNTASSTALYGTLFALSVVKIFGSHKNELMPCMDAVNQRYMSQISMAKMYRPPPRVDHSHQHVSSSTIDLCILRNTAAVKIQTLVRMFQAHQRTVRRQEVVVWQCPRVKSMRRQLTFRAYACLVIYTASVAWINLCYVVMYDAPAIRSWMAATAITVLVDILLRKPLSVLVVATVNTIRDSVRVPGTVYIGKGRSQRPIGKF
ncbi:unnamed protein product [Ectocarpus fasciculatus]